MRSDLETIYKRVIRGYFGDYTYILAISTILFLLHFAPE